jgi:hypothetical protein
MEVHPRSSSTSKAEKPPYDINSVAAMYISYVNFNLYNCSSQLQHSSFRPFRKILLLLVGDDVITWSSAS